MRCRGAPDERGATLVELLITVTLMGIVSTSMAGALVGVSTHSAATRDASVLDAEFRRAVDAIRAAPYMDCSTGAEAAILTGYTDVLPTNRPPGVTMTVENVQFWDGTVAADLTFADTCSSGDKGLQEVTVKVTQGAAQRTQAVVKRRFQ